MRVTLDSDGIVFIGSRKSKNLEDWNKIFHYSSLHKFIRKVMQNLMNSFSMFSEISEFFLVFSFSAGSDDVVVCGAGTIPLIPKFNFDRWENL